MSDNSMLAPLKEIARGLRAEIEELDNQLNPGAAGRKKILDDLLATTDVANLPLIGSIKAAFAVAEQENDDVFIIALAVYLRRVADEHKAAIAAYVEANTPAADETPAVDEAELVALRANRKELTGRHNAIVQLLKEYGDNSLETIKLPRGAVAGAPRGKRLKGSFVFSVDGEPIDGHKLSDLAKGMSTNVTELRAAISAQNEGFDFQSPPEIWRVSLNDHAAVARMSESDSSVEDDDDDDANDSVEDDDNWS